MKHFLLFTVFVLTNIIAMSQSFDIVGHRKNIITLGYFENNDIRLVGTGFLVETDGVFHLLTAKHVVTKKSLSGGLTNEFNDDNLYAFYYSKSGKIENKKIKDIKLKYKLNWITHDSTNVDIAMIPFDIDTAKDDLKVIPSSQFVDTKNLYETYEVYFVCYHPQLMNLNNLKPIFRTGNISRINDDKTILLDAFAFPGNSGSPVFLKSSPTRYDKPGFNIGGDDLADKFIGIIGSYIPYDDIAVSVQTGQPRIIFQENTGIAVIWSVDYLNQIINSDKNLKQISYIKKYFK